MKTFAGIVSFLMFSWLYLMGVAYWAFIYGGIGFFGSLLTSPFSQIIALLIMMFWNFTSFLQIVGLFSIATALAIYAQE